jgi:hypothetical protein
MPARGLGRFVPVRERRDRKRRDWFDFSEEFFGRGV